jgi:hypothetical protein
MKGKDKFDQCESKHSIINIQDIYIYNKIHKNIRLKYNTCSNTFLFCRLVDHLETVIDLYLIISWYFRGDNST